MEHIQDSKTQTRRFSTSSKLFGVGAAMLVATVFMTAVQGVYGGMLAAGLTAASLALGINAFKREQRAARQ